MIPNSKEPVRLKYFKLISLSNMVNKIFSKIIANREATFILEIISPEQGSFINGRLVTKNVVLDQEMVQNMYIKTFRQNVAIKLDIEKTFNKVESQVLYKVLAYSSFDQRVVSLIVRGT